MNRPVQPSAGVIVQESPSLSSTGMGQEGNKPGFLDWLRGIFRKDRHREPEINPDDYFDRDLAEPPRQPVPPDSPLQNHPPLEERIKSELITIPQTGSVHAYIPGRYFRSYAEGEAGNPTSLESVILLAEAITRQLAEHPGLSVSISISGMASYEGIPEKNDALAAERARRAENILREQFRQSGVDEERISYLRSARTVGKTPEQSWAIEELCLRRGAGEMQLIRDYNNGAHGFTAGEVALLDDVLAKNRGVRVSAILSKNSD